MRKFLVVTAVFATALSFTALAQDEVAEPLVTGEPDLVLREDTVPRSAVVETFFDRLDRLREPEKRHWYYRMLKRIGITPGTPGQGIIEEALDSLEAARQELRFDFSQPSEAAFEHDKLRRAEERAAAHGQAYGHMLRQLETMGMPIPSFEAGLDAEVRPGISISIYSEQGGDKDVAETLARWEAADAAFAVGEEAEYVRP